MKQNHFLLDLRKLIFCFTVMLIYVIVYTFSVFVAIQNEGKTYEDYTVSNGLPNHKRYKKCKFLRPIKYYCSVFMAYSGLTKSYVNALNANQ